MTNVTVMMMVMMMMMMVVVVVVGDKNGFARLVRSPRNGPP